MKHVRRYVSDIGNIISHLLWAKLIWTISYSLYEIGDTDSGITCKNGCQHFYMAHKTGSTNLVPVDMGHKYPQLNSEFITNLDFESLSEVVSKDNICTLAFRRSYDWQAQIVSSFDSLGLSNVRYVCIFNWVLL